MYIKAESEETVGGVGHTHPPVCDSDGSSESEESEIPEKLKSVVVVQERTDTQRKSGKDSAEMEMEGGGEDEAVDTGEP